MNTDAIAPTVDFQPAANSARTILMPDASQIFSDRARRFLHLADHHSLADWLRYLGHLTQCQQELASSLNDLPLPDAGALDQARRHNMPPLNAASSVRPAIWHTVLQRLIDKLIAVSPSATLARLYALRDAAPQRLDALATALLNGQPDPTDLADVPLVAAALQTVWTAWAERVDPATLALLDSPGLCPCCGSLPVASIVRSTADTTQVNNLRYLHCSLCNTEWNVPRAVCTACATDRGISYREIDGSSGAVRAECCDTCHSYLKLVVQEKAPSVDPVADDLATLALDLLVDEAGYSRSGPNLLLLGGAG